jgi:hypothetical protein
MKKAMKPAAEISKFAGMRAPLMANTSGVFDRPMLASSRGGTISIPGFAPVNAFPYPGIMRGNTSQIDGLLPGSGRVDMIAANMYRVQDRKDDVASGLGVTGLNSAPKGNASGRSINLTSPNRPIISSTPPPIPPTSYTPVRVKQELTLDQIEAEQEQARIRGIKSSLFNALNPGLGDSKQVPLKLTGTDLPRSNPQREAGIKGIQTRTGQVFPG